MSKNDTLLPTDAEEVGAKLARRLFDSRGQPTSIELHQGEVALLCKLAYQIGTRATTSPHEEETVILLDPSRRKSIPPPLYNNYPGQCPECGWIRNHLRTCSYSTPKEQKHMKYYKVSVQWTQTAVLEVEADDLTQAMQQAPNYPIPADGGIYLPDSFTVDPDVTEQLNDVPEPIFDHEVGEELVQP